MVRQDEYIRTDADIPKGTSQRTDVDTPKGASQRTDVDTPKGASQRTDADTPKGASQGTDADIPKGASPKTGLNRKPYQFSRRYYLLALLTCVFATLLLIGKCLSGNVGNVSRVTYMINTLTKDTAIHYLMLRTTDFLKSEGMYLYMLYALTMLSILWQKNESGKRKDFVAMLPVKRKTMVLTDFVRGALLIVIPYLMWAAASIVESLIRTNEFSGENYFRIVVDNRTLFGGLSGLSWQYTVTTALFLIMMIAVFLFLKQLSNSKIGIFVFLILLSLALGSVISYLDISVASTLMDIIDRVRFTAVLVWPILLLLTGLFLWLAVRLSITEKGRDFGTFRYQTMDVLFCTALFLFVFLFAAESDYLKNPALSAAVAFILSGISAIGAWVVICPKQHSVKNKIASRRLLEQDTERLQSVHKKEKTL